MHILAAAEFLPTNEAPFADPFVLSMFFILAMIPFLAIIGRSAWGTIVGAVVIVTLGVTSVLSSFDASATASQNSKNLQKNITQVYDVDDVSLPTFVSANLFESEALENGLLEVKVTRDGKTYPMYLSQDPETFEPELFPMENPEDFDEWMKDSDK